MDASPPRLRFADQPRFPDRATRAAEMRLGAFDSRRFVDLVAPFGFYGGVVSEISALGVLFDILTVGKRKNRALFSSREP